MNNFADFLYKLRKEKGITQAELANMLGITNKAVSKWETGEAMPETSLLLPLSRIFDISVDELLEGKRKEVPSHPSNENKDFDKDNSLKETFNPQNHLFTRGNDEPPKNLLDVINGIVCAAVFLLGLGCYMFLGGFKGMWHPYWVIMPVCALSCGIISLIFGLFNTEKNSYKISRGENPYTGAICGLIMLSCTIAYLIIGATLNLWHPFWFLFVIGGVSCGIIGAVGDIFVYKNKKSRDKNDY